MTFLMTRRALIGQQIKNDGQWDQNKNKTERK
jgi:hypothetical protein